MQLTDSKSSTHSSATLVPDCNRSYVGEIRLNFQEVSQGGVMGKESLGEPNSSYLAAPSSSFDAPRLGRHLKTLRTWMIHREGGLSLRSSE
jgi:hypothetical protein